MKEKVTIEKYNYSEGDWRIVIDDSGRFGVRTDRGYVCFLPKPFHYTGQDERYEKENKENEANAQLIANCPEMFETLLKIRKRIKDTACEYLNFGENVTMGELIDELIDGIGLTENV